jgi:1-acyl-sn-glycerol-3-phosphate acyltransferase
MSGTGTVRSDILHRISDPVLFWGGLALFGFSCLAWSLPAGLLNRTLPRRMRAPLGQFMIMAGFRCYLATMEALGVFRCDLQALDALRGEGALVIAPNHHSLLDAVLVISRLPRVVCITKASLWDNWFLGGSLRLASYIRNDAPVKLIKLALSELRAGHHLLIFPEGTRTVMPPVNPFKGGFALMAQKAGVPVQTIFIESSSRYLTKGWPLFRRPKGRLIYRARLGQRFSVGNDVHKFVADLEQYFHRELTASTFDRDAA